MGSTRKFNLLLTVLILCHISNFAYAAYELVPMPAAPVPELVDPPLDWTPFPTFLSLSLENPTSSDLLSITVWQLFSVTGYIATDVTYSITDFDINIDIINIFETDPGKYHNPA